MTDLTIKTAWRRDDPQVEADVTDFWARHNLIPEEHRAARAKDLVAVGYRGGRAVAVTAAELTMLHGLRVRFAMGRVSVEP